MRALERETDLPRVGEYIDSGTEGAVFEYGKRVLKLVTRPHDGIDVDALEGFIRWTMKERPSCVVRPYRFGRLKSGNYWYVMERLEPLSNEEKRGFYRLEHLYLKVGSYVRPAKSKIGKEKRRFLEGINRLVLKNSVIHQDFIPHNVMKNRHGRWKFVDLESFVL